MKEGAPGNINKLPPFPRPTDEITLTKIKIKEGQTSDLGVGKTLTGRLAKEIEKGQTIELSPGGNTSNLAEAPRIENGVWIIETATSVYTLKMHKERPVVLHSPQGSIEVPPSMIGPGLGATDFHYTFGNQHEVRINKAKLSGVLLEVEGAQIFRAVEGRLFVLARVGRIHLPFYISSKGTDGKREGEWYPFFGYTGDWLVKGGIDVKGDMSYHPEITRVQKILKENLVLPKDYISPSGKLGTGKTGPFGVEPANVEFDLNQHLKYRNYLMTGEAKNSKNHERDELRFVQRITGYRPDSATVSRSGVGTTPWIKGILSRI